MNSFTFKELVDSTIQESLKYDDPVEYISKYKIDIEIDDTLEDKMTQVWNRETYVAYKEIMNKGMK